MHFSASVVSALHMDPSAGVILIILCRLFMPVPQLALHSSHSPHSVTRQLLGAIQNGQRKSFTSRAHTKKWFGRCSCYQLDFTKLNKILTAFLIYNTFLSLFSRHFAHRAIFRELFYVSLSRSRSHSTGNTTGGPCNPVRHHASGTI